MARTGLIGLREILRESRRSEGARRNATLFLRYRARSCGSHDYPDCRGCLRSVKRRASAWSPFEASVLSIRVSSGASTTSWPRTIVIVAQPRITTLSDRVSLVRQRLTLLLRNSK